MSRLDDDGLVFPSITSTGMSLRDYFAAKAMQSLLCKLTPDYNFIDPDYRRRDGLTVSECAASHAYKFADAMLAQRKEAVE